MKKILILVCVFVLSFGFMSCSKDSSGASDVYMVQINYNEQIVLSPGTTTSFSVTLTKNGNEVDPGDVDMSTFKDSGVADLVIKRGSDTIRTGASITAKYGDVTGCSFGVVNPSGSGHFGLKATYKGVTATITFKTDPGVQD